MASQVKMLDWINPGINKYQVQGCVLDMYPSILAGQWQLAKTVGWGDFFGCSNTRTSKHVNKIWVRPSSWLCELSLASSPSVTEKELLPAQLFLKAFLLGLKYFKSSDTSVTWSFQAIFSWKKIINHKATLYAKPYLTWLHWDRSLRVRKYCSVEDVSWVFLRWLQEDNMQTTAVQLRSGWINFCSTGWSSCTSDL